MFIRSLRRHRYETAYIERNIEGYEPVLLSQISYGGTGTTRGQTAKYPGFSICLRKQDGTLARRQYVLLTNVIRFAGEMGCELPPPAFTLPVASPVGGRPLTSPPPAAPAPAVESRGFVRKLTDKWRGWWHRR